MPNFLQSLAPINLQRKYSQVATDITNYCNARCLFCFNHWEKEKNNLSLSLFNKLLHILPFVDDVRYFFSCLYEPTLNNDFIDMLESIPLQYKNKVFFTTNLVKPISDVIFHRLARVNVNYINISLETFDLQLYERLTLTKSSAFYDNLERMTKIFSEYSCTPNIRFITMILSVNCEELKSIIQIAHKKYNPIEHELRTPYYFENDNSKYLKDFLLPRERIDEVIKELDGIGFKNLRYSVDLDLEKYSIQQPTANSQQPTANSQRLYSKENHYAMRIESNGQVKLNANNEEFDLNFIDNPLNFFSSILVELQKLEASFYLCENKELLKSVIHSSRSFAVLDNTHIYDERFLFLRGWIINEGLNKEENGNANKYVVIHNSCSSDLFYAFTKERQDIKSKYGILNSGFECIIDIVDLKLNLSMPFSISVGIEINTQLECCLVRDCSQK